MNEDVNRPLEPRPRAVEPPPRSHLGSPEARIGAVVALALVAGLVIWLLARGNDNSTPTRRSSVNAASVKDLAALSATVEHPVYWAGPKSGYTYELTRTSDGRIYIRYLARGVSIGSNRQVLAIGTYPLKNALGAVRRIAKQQGTKTMRLNSGGLAVQDTKHPTSIYFAYPGSDYQVEVYDPSPARALQLVVSGKITPIESNAGSSRSTSERPTAATVQQLRAHESSVGHPVYWIGSKAGTIYELTESNGGRIYIRYLPRGREVGDPEPHTTVGTYPFRNPIAAVRAIAKDTGTRTFSVAGGGLAAVDGDHPTSVYVAFPRSNVQIEVFDPSAARARGLVSSGLVVQVR
jgi:hypothetical protein